MDVSLDAIKQKILGRPLRTSDESIEILDDNRFGTSKPIVDELSGKNMESLRKELSCPICHELCYQPVSLHCGHSFCDVCLRWWLTHSISQPSILTNSAASATTTQYGKCPTCRRALSCDGASLGINTALRACITVLFEKETRERNEADKQAKTKAIAGENGGAHTKGYVTLEELQDNSWKTVRNSVLVARRSTVLDSNDQRMQLALAIDGNETIEFTQGSNRSSAVVQVSLCLLTMEEDEVCESGGFPLILRGEDDHALIVTEDRFQYSRVEMKAQTGGKSQPLTTPISRLGLRNGVVHFRTVLGTPALQNATVLYFRDEETGAELEIRLPTCQRTLKDREDSKTMKEVNAGSDGSENLSDHEDRYVLGVDMDQFEDDGFVVDSEEDVDESEEGNYSEQFSNEESDEQESQPPEDLCVICKFGGELLVCDGGNHLDGCGHTYHTECVGRTVVPPGDWVCETCAKGSNIDVGIEGFEFPLDGGDTKGEVNHHIRLGIGETHGDESDHSLIVIPPRRGIKKRRTICDSDDSD